MTFIAGRGFTRLNIILKYTGCFQTYPEVTSAYYRIIFFLKSFTLHSSINFTVLRDYICENVTTCWPEFGS